MNALLKQLQAADTENTELKESVSKLQGQQAALQALVDDRQGGVGTVSMFEHQKIVSQNKELQAQLQQLRMDLELLYMDEQYNTGAVENDTSMGLGGNSEMNPSGGPTSFMSTVQRLGALLGAPESQRGPQVLPLNPMFVAMNRHKNIIAKTYRSMASYARIRVTYYNSVHV